MTRTLLLAASLILPGAAAAQSTVPTSRGDVPLQVPASYAAGEAAPLVVLLHGYGSDADWVNEYTGLSGLVDEYGFFLAHPSGTEATTERNPRFWNASTACCNFAGSTVDDSGYVLEVIDEMKVRFAIDPDRVYVVGHSNGGFMSYRVAQDHPDVIAAIVSLAGAASSDHGPAPASPVHVLQVHGTADETILYEGGEIGETAYPGAVESAERWAAYAGCSTEGDVDATRVDLDDAVDGAETTVTRYRSECRAGGSSELWTIRDGTHVPRLNEAFSRGIVEWLLAHPKRTQARDSLATAGLPLEPARTVSMTTDRGSWMSLDLSPDGSTIVFDLLGDLYTMPVTGGAATPLLVGPAFEAQPRFSPDGSEIVFVSDRSGGQNLWVLAADGSDTTQLTTGNGNLYTSPEWTPDGTYVVASRTFSPLGGAAKPYLFHRNGGSGVALVDEPANLKLIGPAFEPEGRYIYMAQGTGDWTYDAIFPEYQLVRYDRETGQRTTMTSRYGSGFRPAVSPDGSTLVYGTRHEDATGLRVRDLASGDERWLLYPVQRDDMESRATLDILPGYSFTPDGSALIASYDGGFWRIPIDGSAPTAIPFSADVTVHLGPRLDFDYPIEDTPTFLARQIRDPVLSPDGASVAMTVLGRLYVANADGTDTRRLAAEVPGLLAQPAWSPDGRTIAVTSWDEPAGGQLWAVNAGSGAARQVSTDARFIHSAAWSADGSRIVALQAPVAARLDGGVGALTDIVWYPSAGGDATVIAPSRGRSAPHVRPASPDRIHLFGGGDGLVSIRWDGTDPKEHLKVTGPSRASGGSPLNASWIGMAPTGDRAVARVENDLYLLTVPQVGGGGVTISVRNLDGAAFPVTKLTEIGGEFPAWSADGREVTWALGHTLFRYDIDRAEFVADSIAEAERAGATTRDDEDAAEEESGAEADDAPDEPGGYEPTETGMEIAVPRDLPEGAVVLRGARVVTMVGDEVIERGDVVVEGNRIRAVGPTGTVTVPDGAEVRDVSGMTILPGFVDTHAHMRPPSEVHTTQPWPYLANLAFGVTTTRDPQTGVSDVLTYADRVRAGEVVGPRIYSTGPGVFGSYQGANIRDLDHARDILRRYAEHYDTKTFKMYLAGNRQQRQWLIMAARELELMPTTEAGIDLQLDLTQAMDGYPGIEHNLPVYPLYDDVVTLFAEARVVNTPTLIVSFGGPMGEIYWFTRENVHDDERLRRFTPHETLDGRTRRRAGAAGAMGWAVEEEFVFEEHARFLRDVVDAGGFAGVGSHGQLQGLGFHWEMWMLGSGGMSNHDVLRSATIFGANGIGLERELGSIETGKLADLVILSENPLTDLRATTSVDQVMVNGRLFDAASLAEVWPRQRPLPYRGFVEDEPVGR